MLVVAVVAALWGLASSALFDVDRIDVVGAERTGAAMAGSTSGIELGDALLRIDLGDAEDRVAGLPWVESVTVSRAWPGTVELAVVERRAVAAARYPAAVGRRPEAGSPADDGPGPGVDEPVDWMLLSADGHQVERVDGLVGPPPDVVVIDGVEPDDEPGAVLSDAVGALRAVAVAPDELRPRLARIVVTADGDLEAVVSLPDEGGEIPALLGPAVDLGEKMVALATVVDQAELTGATSVNVRVPASPVLTREPAPE